MRTIRNMLCTFAAASFFAAASAANAQTAQEQLDARHDRALAAGYKALMLCSAIFNAREAGAERSVASVLDWELNGIYPSLEPLLADLPHELRENRVTVEWAQDMPPRLALYRRNEGCRLAPIGLIDPELPRSRFRTGAVAGRPSDPWTLYYPPYVASQARPELVQPAFDETYGAGSRTSAALVVHKGKLVAERYAPGFDENTPQRTWSVAKSIAATIVGFAVHRGQVEVGQSAGLGASEDDPRKAITIDHLLRMASGRYSDTPGNRTDPLYFGGSGVAEAALNWPLIHQPGTTFRYANNDTLAASAAVEATEPGERFFSGITLISTVGMYDTTLETDWTGSHILSSQVWSTARDLARFGLLYLKDGMVGRTRLLPEGWVKYISSPSGPQPEGEFGYGAGFWLMNKSPGIPADTFAAFGNRGQYVVIIPGCDAVIVRRGEDPTGARFDIAGFTRDVLAKLGCSEK